MSPLSEYEPPLWARAERVWYAQKVACQNQPRKGECDLADMTLREMQQDVHRYISQFREGYFHPMTLVVRLAEELGELAREVNHRYGQKPKKPDKRKAAWRWSWEISFLWSRAWPIR
jgi:hypothetical protein